MKKLILLSAILAANSDGALADDTQAQKVVAVPPVKTTKPAQQATTKSVRLSDAELDQITAAGATHETGHGTTVVFNPGNANVLIRHKHGVTCINCF